MACDGMLYVVVMRDGASTDTFNFNRTGRMDLLTKCADIDFLAARRSAILLFDSRPNASRGIGIEYCTRKRLY